MEKQLLAFYKVKNDVYGNPRYAIDVVAEVARRLGGKAYRGAEYGGGHVFQSYNTTDLFKRINKLYDGFYGGYEVYTRGWVSVHQLRIE
jgi:hypothetical protein